MQPGSDSQRITTRTFSSRGFSLIESLVALLLVTVALFLALHLTTIQPRAMQRVRANESALRAVEAVLEIIRGGTVPVIEGRRRWERPTDLPPDPAIAGMQVILDVTPIEGVDDLYSVTVEARYLVSDRVQLQRLQTLVWRPS